MDKDRISIEDGNGGLEMTRLLNSFLPNLNRGKNWKNFTNDSATFTTDSGEQLCFTTDSFVVNPIEFPGGNIGHLAICGTINDLVVMGATPIGLSLALIIEEGFEKEKLNTILNSINEISKSSNIPIVTGDTKVMEKGAIDKIVINTSGIGIINSNNNNNNNNNNLFEQELNYQDKIIISGGIGEHGVALLSKRFDFETRLISDCKPLHEEMNKIKPYIKFAKDPTRGGISAIINEIAKDNNCKIELIEKNIPIKKEVKSACNLLGLEAMELANEGKILCICKPENEEIVLNILKQFNPMATTIGEIKEKKENGEVILKTNLGTRLLTPPSGKIVPRIC
ncbi:MAG: hydrogenase expression/formation protein HypE [Nanoarchaeota archaeon]|nr:hydrogenase expression/formation protein HypE [Nanoarchaeota archaeon]